MSEENDQNLDNLRSAYQEIDKEVDRKVWLSRAVPATKSFFFHLIAFIEIFIIVGGLFYLGYYLAIGLHNEREQLASMTINISSQSDASLQALAQPLIISRIGNFPSPGDRTDYIALVENVNERWLAEFNYFFSTPDGNTSPKRGYVLPNRSFYANDIGSEINTSSRNIDLVIDNLNWHRVSASTIPDLEDWLDFREDINISNINHGSSITISDTEIIQTTFDIDNQTPFSYWDVDLLVLLTSGRNIVGVNRVRLPGLDSNESRSMTVNWFGNVSRSASVEIYPQINFFDPQIYRDNPIDSVQDIRNSF